ncbi:alanine:cation symporter family protein [Chitinibacter bivalviorum]|uniref:Alanine:cation symporter family protein n=1 Tax=Chitinibacter bivalviorum TaxID=2739434 RepID=A0A7H9BEW0_9NEIS|nr:alanine/glycine:cation symporter family protein [Chitinibacter bivalviorum]QLG87159.1 alanine:cation symporter family protein [Chitinibacter bivalviorum]
MQAAVDWINGWVWSNGLIFLCLAAGLYFSIRTRFLQLRHFGEMFRLMFDGKASAAGVSSFQALAMSLSGRVGIGNIAGVATAIAFGGPGAVFWMWMVAFLGASTAFVEATLGQLYKEEHHGQYRGGPAFYIEKGLGWKWYSIIFALATIFACGILLPGMQGYGIASGLQNAFGMPPAVTGAIVVLMLGMIIFGGVKRIASFTQFVVPFMALGYLLIAFTVVALNISALPDVLMLIVKSAFGAEAGFGAMLGLAIQWGVKRGIYSNEAGQGSAPHAAAAAEVSHPAKQGLVQAFSVYIDTLVVCSATAFMILITGKYNVIGPDGQTIVSGVAGIEAGAAYTQAAVESVLPGFGAVFVGIALFFFAFTTMLSYYYVAETNLSYLCRKINAPWLFVLLKLILLAAALYGCVRTSALAWGMGDIGVGVMAWLNIIAILVLQKPALALLKDYETQQAQGLDPVFSPAQSGIAASEIWSKKAQLISNAEEKVMHD